MDIYILHEGQESGPYSERSACLLLAQGDVAANDLAWRTGMSDWVPLNELLSTKPAANTPVPVSVPASTGSFEPATAKQKALLSYLGLALSADLSRDQAARMVNDAMEDPGNAERLTRWNEERLRLHPELFAAEIQAKRENRANHFFELCQSAGTEYFSGVAKAHCQVLVGFLDVKFPHWDARESEAAEHYFFPAVAEKFPQLVNKAWRGRLHYPDGMKIAPEIVHKSPTSKLRQSATSPLVAATRGLVLGVLILGVLYLGYRTMRHDVTAAPAAETTTVAEKSLEPVAATDPQLPPPSRASISPTPPVVGSAVPPQNLPSIDPVAPIATTEPTPAPIPTAAPTVEAPTPAPMSIPAPAVAAMPDPSMSPAPMAADPASPMAAAPTAPAPSANLDPAMMAINSTALANAPMAALPGTEPPVPVAPPPATMPTPAALPTTDPNAALVPPLPVPEPQPTVAVAATKTNLFLTKPVEIQLTYGKIMLAPGTAVKLVSRQGAVLKVSYQNNVISVPVTSTDLE